MIGCTDNLTKSMSVGEGKKLMEVEYISSGNNKKGWWFIYLYFGIIFGQGSEMDNYVEEEMDMAKEVVKLYRQLHQIPEIGLQ